MLIYPIPLDAGPGPLLALLPEPDPDALAETAIAFANTDGGTVVLGQAPEAIELLLRQAADRCHPAILFGGWERRDTGAVAIQVPRGASVHTLADGRVLVRAQQDNRLLNGQEIRRLVAARASGDFEAEIIPGASLDDLDSALVADFAARQPQGAGTLNHFLAGIGAITPDQGVTVAGMLLFGRDPRHWLPQSRMVLTHAVGKKLAPEEKSPGYDLSGPLVHLIEQGWQWIGEHMKPGAYPAQAVREALVNAICHRDYRLHGRCLEVRLYADRLEVISPGGLPGFLTVEYLTQGRFSRNPRLAWSLFTWGYVPEPGWGINRMVEAMHRHGCPRPQFDARSYSFTVTLSPARPGAAPEKERPLNERQSRALTYVTAHGSITARELHTLCPGVSIDTIRRDLADLVEQGRLRKIGSRTSAYYILP